MEPSDQGWAGYSRKPTSTSNVPSVLQSHHSFGRALDAGDSPAQAKLFTDSTACQRRAPLLQARLGKTTIFEVLDITFDEFASIIAFGAADAPSQFAQSPLNIGIQPDGER
jgi:hypothetical protein